MISQSGKDFWNSQFLSMFSQIKVKLNTKAHQYIVWFLRFIEIFTTHIQPENFKLNTIRIFIKRKIIFESQNYLLSTTSTGHPIIG